MFLSTSYLNRSANQIAGVNSLSRSLWKDLLSDENIDKKGAFLYLDTLFS
jgi:hypothetical protein